MSTDHFDLTGRTALITGASRGLGQVFGRALARAGADLIVTSRKAEDLTPFCHEVEAIGRRALPLELDVRDQYSIEAMCKAAIAAVDGIDVLVNNAGCNIRKPALEVTWEDWNTILDTNLRGTFFIAQAVARHMIERQYGRIVNIGSVTCVAGEVWLAFGEQRPVAAQLEDHRGEVLDAAFEDATTIWDRAGEDNLIDA